MPQPVLTSFRLWDGHRDFGYAYHQWALDADDEAVIPFLAQPFEDAPLYTCNESYSDMQGWVNGSLRSANLVLAKMGIGPMDTSDLCSDDWTRDAVPSDAVAGGFWGLTVQAGPSGR